MRKLAAAAAALIMSTSLATAENYTLQSTFGLNVPSIGPSPQNFAKLVSAMTDGEVNIEVHGAGDFVPPFEVFGAVSSGALDMGFDWSGYWSKQIPVANIVGSMPFGPSPDIALAWMFHGGGMEIIQKAYDPFNVHFIPCHLVISEAGGWFNKEINTIEDFKGLRMRIAGLGGLTLAKLGASTQTVPVGEIYISLETGRLDATEFSAPSLDVGLGFQRVAKNYYFPGWHQPSSWDSIIVNGDVWKKMGEEKQNILIQACKANITYNLADQVNSQAAALAEIRKAGTQVRRFPDEVLAKLKVTADEVMDEQAENDPLFAEALKSLRDYMGTVGEWTKLQNIPAQD
ncbi:TRAP transporter substrate-binding protein [uncultured Roseibium sp.]|uniref:TRAP transporter substrate-binding protein n=1 Tax=uncultured Roseibium sp. TaxID=1936171 RepID=UPI003217E199